MSRETQFIFEVWDCVRDIIPANKRVDIAESILRSAADYGFEPADLSGIVEEDDDLAEAFGIVFDDYEEEEEEE